MAIRNIDTYYRSFKAEEWSLFLTQYSPVFLCGPRCPQHNIYEHYIKLVNVIDLAIDYDIMFENLDVIELLLHEFISDYEQLYYRYQLQ